MRPRVLCLSLLLILSAGAALAEKEFSAFEFTEMVEKSTATHAWAGAYYAFGGLYIAPDGRYCSTTWSCFGTGYGPCGRLRPDGDRLVETGWNPLNRGFYHGPPYLRVPWGDRRYLVPESGIVDFINDVNEAREPRVDNGGAPSAFLRRDEGDILVTGRPLLPERYRSMLLAKPLITTAVEIGTRTKVVTHEGSLDTEDCGAEARFDAGSSSGVFVGMKLHPHSGDEMADVVIAKVEAGSSSGRIKQFSCDNSVSLPKGTRFGSRPRWRMASTLSTEPMTTEILFASSKRHPPFFGGKPQEFIFDDPFFGASAAGFAVEPVATVIFRGPFLGALGLKASEARIERTMLSLGANAFEWLEERPDLKAEEAGGVEKKTARLHRLSYRGKAIDPGHHFYVRSVPHKSGAPLREDWKGAAIAARAVLCGLPEAGRAAERSAALELLRWDEADLARAHELRFENLGPDRRRAAEALVPPGKRHGFVWPALMLHSDFTTKVLTRGLNAELEYRRVYPEAAAECEKRSKAERARPF